MILVGRYRSPFTRRVAVTLHLTGIPFERRIITAWDAQKFGNSQGLQAVEQWCKSTGVTKVYVESFRSGVRAEREVLERFKEVLGSSGIEVSGGITTLKLGKDSTGWSCCCYTDLPTQQRLQEEFEYAAELFDEIMIDDFWFTDCECAECDAARKARLVTIGRETFSVPGDTYEDYRREMMVRLSRDRILTPARRVNPDVKIIIKYPCWYDQLQGRGYDADQQTGDFDRIWVGTETRDYDDPEYGGTAAYRGFFIMRWFEGIGGEKCGGGWYDFLGTHEDTYIEQARQTILGGARESLLFNYGGLQKEQPARDVEALRGVIPELFAVAEEVAGRRPVGVAAYKPINSHRGAEGTIFDFLGMIGLPLVPCHEFPAEAAAGFFSVQALKDSGLVSQLSDFIASGKPTLITDGLAAELRGDLDLDLSNVRILKIEGTPESILELPQGEIDSIREGILPALGLSLKAPSGVGFYPFEDGSWVLENFNDSEVAVELNGMEMTIAPRGWTLAWK